MVYYCSYCGAKNNHGGMCKNCREKLVLIRKIKAMLKPYYQSKKARERGKRENNND